MMGNLNPYASFIASLNTFPVLKGDIISGKGYILYRSYSGIIA